MVGENTEAPATETTTGTKRGRAKERIGLVVGANAAKTIVVAVERRVKNTAYGKYQNRQKKYAVHDLLGCTVGEFVRIVETKPISKTKRWRAVEKLGRDKASLSPMIDE